MSPKSATKKPAKKSARKKTAKKSTRKTCEGSKKSCSGDCAGCCSHKVENPYLPRPVKVIEYYRETPDTFTITIDYPCEHEPGQFVQVSVPGIGESPISICSDSREYLKLNIRQVGNVTNALSQLKKGDTVFVRGPYGHGYPMQHLTGNNLVIIGGGCGVAPLKGIIDYVENHRSDYDHVRLFLGYRSPNDIIFSRELDEWQQQYHLEVTVDDKPTDSCYTGPQGFITEAVKHSGITNHNTVAFVCGPPKMMDITVGILKEKGFNDDQIFLSAERLMYCAVGACCHCMIRGKYTCIDGPVFRYDELKGFTND